MQRTLPLLARATIAKTRVRQKGVCELIRTKMMPRAFSVDIYCGFADNLDPHGHARVVENDVEVGTHPIREELRNLSGPFVIFQRLSS